MIEQFVITGGPHVFRIFDTESDTYVAKYEFNSIAKAQPVLDELNDKRSKVRAKHLDHVIDVLSGVENG